MKQTNLFVDAEWYINQEIFLLGYAYDDAVCKQLYGKKLTRLAFKKILKRVSGYVYGYGPDIGMLEKFFAFRFRDKYKCVNLMKVFRDCIKKGSFKLKDLEEKFGIKRKVSKYKTSIFHIWKDWRNPRLKVLVLQYNLEDVVNLVKLTKIIFKKYKVKTGYLNSIRLT